MKPEPGALDLLALATLWLVVIPPGDLGHEVTGIVFVSLSRLPWRDTLAVGGRGLPPGDLHGSHERTHQQAQGH